MNAIGHGGRVRESDLFDGERVMCLDFGDESGCDSGGRNLLVGSGWNGGGGESGTVSRNIGRRHGGNV